MIDPGTGLTILGTAVDGAKVVEKILDPTAEYVGQQLKDRTGKNLKIQPYTSTTRKWTR